jgi:hypothetical protein
MSSINGENITVKDVERVQHFWHDTLDTYRFVMGVSQQAIVQETIDLLMVLKVKVDKDNLK